jgi:FAD/FMN-containing dehydrogenase
MTEFSSWGNYPRVKQSGLYHLSRDDSLPDTSPLLPFGNGRSYGDCCLIESGTVVATRKLDNFISFDRESGLLKCEAGVLLRDILELTVQAGWFLPVSPGTSLVTVGGAIANDVHGKNHHVRGTFGCHVSSFEVLRSDNSRTLCSESNNPELFQATIGGLGLTGLITWAELQLVPVQGNGLALENIKFSNLDDFFALTEDSDEDYEYTASWVDCSSAGSNLGRGIFSRANHCAGTYAGKRSAPTFPVTPPISLIHKYTVRPFNFLYYHKQFAKRVESKLHYSRFLYPLDSIHMWNRVYGRPGFLQYQFVVPLEDSREVLEEILGVIVHSGMGSALAVLKVCGDIKSPGLLSFPMPGVSLALDFPNRGQRTHQLFAHLDEIIVKANGRLYAAKDAHMNQELYKKFYPQWEALEKIRDPAFCSSLWQRVTQS